MLYLLVACALALAACAATPPRPGAPSGCTLPSFRSPENATLAGSPYRVPAGCRSATLTWADNGRRLVVPLGFTLHVRPGARVLPTGSNPGGGTVLRRTDSSQAGQDYVAGLPGMALISANSALHDRGSGYVVAVQVEGIDLQSARFTSAQVGWGATGLRFEKDGSTVAGVARTTDGGHVWREVGPPLAPSGSRKVVPVFPPVVVVPVSDQAAWAFAGSGSPEAHLTTDGGRTWSSRPIDVPALSAAASDTKHAIVFFDATGLLGKPTAR